MQKIWNKRHRISAGDEHLVYHFSIGTFLFLFVAVLLLLNKNSSCVPIGNISAC